MTVESAADQALALKKRARRRLVGAVALVLLMLIILPNVLKDREQEEQRAPITLTMPEEVQTAPEAAVPENPATEQANIAAPEAENTTPPALAENLATPQPSTISPPAVSPPVEAPKPAEIPAKIAPVTPKTDVKNTVNPEVAKPKEAKATRFLIQVGVFSDAENVKKLQTKISEAGFSSRTVKLNTPKGEKIRLRVGSFVTRDAAAEALKKMEAHGLSGMVLMDE